MDFWSRLLANTPLSSESHRRDNSKDPVRRLRRFEKEYSHLLQTWRNSSNLAKDNDAADYIEYRLQELTHILSDESQRPLPHPCIAFSATKQLYVPIAKIATTSYNEWIIKEAVLFFATLIESEEEAFVESDAFAASLTNLLVKITGANSIRLSSETESRVVELAFNITTKIRQEPHILSAWFKSQRNATSPDEKSQDSRDRFEGHTKKQDFPLFYLLIDYIHHEGKVGDFARTGLLYIIEAASNSVALEQWIVESDLSTLMATGLGALYSQLSRKLVIDYPTQDLPPVLAFSDYQPPVSTYEIISSVSPEFQIQLETFLSHLAFWQDVLNHCKSVEVKSTLLEHFQIIFLQQLLYPSLLESSDIDGGSSVAVLTYLRHILESLDHPDMINLILHYLLALPDFETSSPEVAQSSVSKARKRKSMDLATMMASKEDDAADPLLFNLVDLIHACLKSQSHQTIHVTLQLVSAILKRHHRYAVTTLIRTETLRGDISQRTVGAHQQEIEYLMSLAGSIGGQDNFDELYDAVLKDTTVRLEGHPCSLKLVAPKLSMNNHKLPAVPDSLPGAPRDVRTHTIRSDDPLLAAALDHLEVFFVNPVETNLSVTDAIFDLAVCGFMHIEGWLLRNPESYIYDDDEAQLLFSSKGDTEENSEDLDTDSAEVRKLERMHKCRQRPMWTSSNLPRLLKILQRLSDEVITYRETIPRFDDLLQQRREAFQTADMPPATPGPTRAPGLDPRSLDNSRSGSPARPSGLEGFAQRILKDLDKLGSPGSRSGGPLNRGLSASSGIATLTGGYGIGTPTNLNKPMLPVPPKDFPLGFDTPSRGGSGMARSYSPGSQRGDTPLGADPIAASQAAAFQAVDQQILARKVGLPLSKKVAAIPLRLGGRLGAEKSDEPVVEEVVQQETAAKAEVDGEASEEGQAVKEDVDGDIAQTPKISLPAPPPEDKTVSVSHVLTNVIILQSFLFELAALVQVRAGLFDEVRFA